MLFLPYAIYLFLLSIFFRLGKENPALPEHLSEGQAPVMSTGFLILALFFFH